MVAASVDEYKRQRRNTKTRRKTFINRRDAVQKALNKAYDMDDYKTKINNKISDCSDNLRNGIKGSSVASKKSSNISSKKETSSVSSQYPYSDAITEMRSEINRCNTEIGTCDRQIRYYEQKIKELGGTLMPWE